ncbi:MAG: DUF1501 domain-containing protein [Ignavibacteria bacterium]|nr:DUF1501 domain-containing protein [Ignavibacteria bacterium]
MKRRDFIKTVAIGSAGAALTFNSIPMKALGLNSVTSKLINPFIDTDKVLVIIEMLGGNDGLNTVIPYQDSQYYVKRPVIGIPSSTVLNIPGSTMGLHPSLTELKNLLIDGKLAVVQNVGYPNPNFSHFRATDIWHTASDSNLTLTTGWLGRYLHEEYPNFPNQNPPDPMSIQIGTNADLSLISQVGNMALTFQDPNQFYQLVQGGTFGGYERVKTLAGDELNFTRKVSADSLQYATRVKQAADNGQNLATYPTNNKLADQLKIVSKLIDGGLNTRLYVVSMGGFDTHSNQLTSHQSLMNQLNSAISAFMQDLQLNNINNRVVGMTMSEFGRRVNENGSAGTDHGTAAPMILFGDLINEGIYGNNPDLVNLVNNNLVHQYDFRQIYASVLKQLFAASDSELLNVLLSQFNTLPLIIPQAQPPQSQQRSDFALSQNFPNPFNPVTRINYTLKKSSNVSLKVYDVSGKIVQTLTDSFKSAGEYSVTFDVSGRSQLSSGIYFYKLKTDGFEDTKRMTLIK